MNVIITIIALICIFYGYYLIVIKQGNLSFWMKAAKHPDFVYKLLVEDEAWIIDDGYSQIDKTQFDGPFMLHVPSLGKTVKFYGEVGKYENSQKKIKMNIANIKSV